MLVKLALKLVSLSLCTAPVKPLKTKKLQISLKLGASIYNSLIYWH